MYLRVALHLQVVDRHFQVAHAQLDPVRRHGGTNQLQVEVLSPPLPFASLSCFLAGHLGLHWNFSTWGCCLGLLRLGMLEFWLTEAAMAAGGVPDASRSSAAAGALAAER